MLSRITATLLSTLFLLFLMAPTVIMMVDKSADVSIFYTINEEEEKKGQEKEVDKKIVINQFLNGDLYDDFNNNDNNLEYFLKRYWKPYINLISPPPEGYIL